MLAGMSLLKSVVTAVMVVVAGSITNLRSAEAVHSFSASSKSAAPSGLTKGLNEST
jgi:hypothetical protein